MAAGAPSRSPGGSIHLSPLTPPSDLYLWEFTGLIIAADFKAPPLPSRRRPALQQEAAFLSFPSFLSVFLFTSRQITGS